ncbi:MAG: APC family permease [Bacillota bacterium]|nr:APC family permease [Bacillota bacterium]
MGARPASGEPQLRRNSLGLLEVVALSISIIAPTMAMSLNTPLVAGASGGAVAITFAVATVAMVLAGVSFVEFGKRLPSAGSAFTYVTYGLGPRAGFVSGWGLLLTYWAYAAGTAAAFGNFAVVFLEHFGLHTVWWLWALLALGVVWAMGVLDVKLSTRAALAIEGVSVLIILALTAAILARGGQEGLTLQPFLPQKTGLAGIGFAIVYAVLSFAGFEGAATLGEEAQNPRRAVPWAVLGTVVIAGLFFVFVGWAETVGFGMRGVAAFAKDAAPLDTLGVRYVGAAMATVIDLGAAISAFACSLGSATAAARILYAMSRDGALPRVLGYVEPSRRTPLGAHTAVVLTALVADLAWSRAGGFDVYSAWGTLGTLTLIVAYLMVNAAAVRYFGREYGRPGTSAVRHLVFPILGFLILLWPLYNSVWPLQPGVFGVLPFVAAAWLVTGWLRISLMDQERRALIGQALADAESPETGA